MPRRDDSKDGPGVEGRSDHPDRAPRPSGASSDEQALIQRDSGQTYAAIAQSLGFKRALDAQAAFLRALRTHQGDDQLGLIQRESARLDKLETRIRTRDAAEPEKMERRLKALAKLRASLG